VKAQETTFQALIQGEKQFQVPLYQRTYSWQEQQLRQLWSDILDQAEVLASGSPGPTHFLGSVVLAPSPSLQAAGVQRWLVVDGQQRLTTLMLAMCALRDHLAATNPIERERINELYLTNRWKSGGDIYRLLPTQADRESFFACINGTPAAGGGDAIGAAYRFFRQALVAADDEVLRERFRRMLNEAPGIDLPEAKLGLRPPFPLSALADKTPRERVFDALEWFALTARDPQPAAG
jgi:hypothetical protein